MNVDPRSKNIIFNSETASQYLNEYTTSLKAALQGVDPEQLEKALQMLRQTAAAGRHIYVCGNGGSAAIADHLCCDWTKGTRVLGTPPLRTHSLSANGALSTAIANDFGLQHMFSFQVDAYGDKGDVLVAISSSGESANIVAAVEAAQARGMTVIGLSGFSGGQLNKRADIKLHVNFANYGLVEDAHQVIMHVLGQCVTIAFARAADTAGAPKKA